MVLGTGTKILLLIFMMHSFLFIGVIESRPITQPFIEDFGLITLNETDNLTRVSFENRTLEELNITADVGIQTGTISFDFNPLSAIFGAFAFFWGFVSSPLTLLALDIPWQLKLVFIAPLGVLYLVALIGFLRGKDL